jgi:hypothetical protein
MQSIFNGIADCIADLGQLSPHPRHRSPRLKGDGPGPHRLESYRERKNVICRPHWLEKRHRRSDRKCPHATARSKRESVQPGGH